MKTMENQQTEQPTPKTSPTPTHSQVESLAAFLSDWSEESIQIQAPTMAEEKADTEHQIHSRQLSPSPHPPAALPGCPIPPGTLRRRSSHMGAASDNDEGNANGGGNGGHGATQPPPALPFPSHDQRQNDNDQNSPLQHHETTSNIMMSPSCARTDLHEGRSARSGGGGIPPPPPPLLVNSRLSGHRVDTEADEVEASSISISVSTSNRAD